VDDSSIVHPAFYDYLPNSTTLRYAQRTGTLRVLYSRRLAPEGKATPASRSTSHWTSLRGSRPPCRLSCPPWSSRCPLSPVAGAGYRSVGTRLRARSRV